MGNMCCCISDRQKRSMDARKALGFSTDIFKKSKTSNKHNLRATKDIISNLVDDVLLLILSFLDIKVAAQTSILSRRWRYLWSSLRVLNIDQRFYPWFKKYPFTNSLDKVIAVLCDVQEIHLKLSSELPQCIFTWESIRILKLKGVDGFLWIRNPHSVNLPALKVLHLTRVVLDMELLNDFLSKCPVLEVLSLKCCEFVNTDSLNISCPKLTKLVIKAYDKNYGCLKHYEIKIFAPNLTIFKFCDSITRRFSLHDISSLARADIDLKVDEHFVLLGSKAEYAKRVIKFMEGIGHAEFIQLSESSLEMFALSLEVQCMPTQFSNLRHLRMTGSPNHACTHVLQLLKNSPNIESLILEITWANFNSYQGRLYWDEPLFYPTIMAANWEMELQFDCMLHHLKTIEIRNFLGCENEVKLLKVLLKSANSLEKIKIVLAQVWPHSRKNMMWVVWRMLQRFPRASPNIDLEFVNLCVLQL